MASATNTAIGEIRLAGDLAGNNNALAPELPASGVAAGSYTLANITVNSKGIVTAASAGTLPIATTTDLGMVRVTEGNGLTLTAGTLAMATPATPPDATTSSKGIVQVTQANGLTISGGILAMSVQPDATTSSKGIVQVTQANGLTISGGVLSYAVQDASTSVKGVVQVTQANGLTISSGVLAMAAQPDATSSSKGIVQVTIGNGLNISGGVLSYTPAGFADATTSTKGVVQVGTNIDVAAGVISVADGSNATKGVVKSANANNITITAGEINVGSDIPQLSAVNTWTAAQTSYTVALTDGATINVNAALGNIFTVTLGGNRTLANPTNLSAIQSSTLIFKITQDGTGGRELTFDSNYKFKQGFSKLLSSTAGATDVIVCVTDGTTLYCSVCKEFA